MKEEQLATLLQEKMQGAVILTHDETASQWKERLGHHLVYGIREAKVCHSPWYLNAFEWIYCESFSY